MNPLTKLFILLAALISGTSYWIGPAFGDDDADQQPHTPANQNDVQVDKNPPKAAVTGVQSQSAGAPQRGGSLDPAQQSSMGLGIQIPLGHSDTSPPNTGPSKQDKDDE
jgi:hypothetical protein